MSDETNVAPCRVLKLAAGLPNQPELIVAGGAILDPTEIMYLDKQQIVFRNGVSIGCADFGGTGQFADVVKALTSTDASTGI